MIRLGLVVTGRMEKAALGESLRRVFQRADLEVVPAQLTDAFTTARLGAEPILVSEKGTRSAVLKMATALVALVDPGRRGQPVDLAIAVDDLELANADQPQRSIEWFLRAIDYRLAELEAEYSATKFARVRELVRHRCSFHLFVPMPEAYFFGEGAAVERAGATRNPRLSSADLERFETDDADYTFGGGDPKHPKQYLSFLTSATYRETVGGASAPRELSWRQVAGEGATVPFARSFLNDIAEGCGERSDFGADHPLTRRVDVGRLRNLE